jgi:hypothetical protein
MIELSQLYSRLKEVDQDLEAGKPSFIKKAKTLFRFENIGIIEDGQLILMGMVFVCLETEDKYAIRDVCGFSETYGRERTREEAEQCILKDLLSYSLLEEGEFDGYWAKEVFDKVRWMDKKVDMYKFFSLLDSLHVGLWQNMPLYVENSFITFDPIREQKSVKAKDVNGTISFHVVTDKSDFVLEWDKYWYSGEEQDIDLTFCSWAETIIEKGDYYRIWDSINFEEEDWKKKADILVM